MEDYHQYSKKLEAFCKKTSLIKNKDKCDDLYRETKKNHNFRLDTHKQRNN